MRATKLLLLSAIVVSIAYGCKHRGTRLTIGFPKNDSHFARGDTIHFAADLNSDVDFGVIPSSAWTWTSDRDGTLAKSPRLDTPNLSPGKHVITVTVPHRLGTSSANVTVFVDSAASK